MPTSITEVWGDYLRFNLQCKDWQTHAVPGVGKTAQDVVNKTAFNDYDIYVGIMGDRFGTPTAKAGSGTEEEFNEALRRAKAKPPRTKILFMFGRRADLFQMNLSQAEKVEKFRQRLGEEGLLWDQFTDDAELEKKVRRHLGRILQEVLKPTENKSAANLRKKGRRTRARKNKKAT